MILTGAGDKKIQVIKEVRALTSLGLKEAKDLVDGAPQPVLEKVNEGGRRQRQGGPRGRRRDASRSSSASGFAVNATPRRVPSGSRLRVVPPKRIVSGSNLRSEALCYRAPAGNGIRQPTRGDRGGDALRRRRTAFR